MHTGGLLELAEKARESNATLSECLIADGYAQNLGKQVAVLAPLGAGSRIGMQLVREGRIEFGGSAADYTRSLGAQVHASGSFTKELLARKQAVRKAFYSMTGFWGASGVPGRWRRAMFMCKVLNAALANIEAFLPSDSEYHQLTLLVSSLGRVGMRGKAHSVQDDKHRALGWRQVLRFWQVGSIREEALIRRLRWYQAMARFPKEHVQPLAALFSRCRFEVGPTVGVNGEVLAAANPWAKRVQQDLEEAGKVVEDMEVLLAAATGVLCFFRPDSWIAEQFCMVDFAAIRSSSWTAAVPPPLHGAAAVGGVEEVLVVSVGAAEGRPIDE